MDEIEKNALAEEEKRRKEMLRLIEETGKLVNGEPLRV